MEAQWKLGKYKFLIANRPRLLRVINVVQKVVTNWMKMKLLRFGALVHQRRPQVHAINGTEVRDVTAGGGKQSGQHIDQVYQMVANVRSFQLTRPNEGRSSVGYSNKSC